MSRKGLLFTTLAMLASSSISAMEWEFDPYIGADIQWRHSNFKSGFGNNLFAHTYPGGNAYVGVKFHQNFGIELGYEAARSQSRVTTLTTGDVAAGVTIPAAISPTIFRGVAKFQGPHLDLVGYYKPCIEYSTELVGSVGVAYLKSSFERRTLLMANLVSSNTVRTMSQNKAVLRVMGGLQHMFDDNWGFRAMVGWEGTTNITARANDGNFSTSAPPIVKPKNSTIYSLGLLWAY